MSFYIWDKNQQNISNDTLDEGDCISPNIINYIYYNNSFFLKDFIDNYLQAKTNVSFLNKKEDILNTLVDTFYYPKTILMKTQNDNNSILNTKQNTVYYFLNDNNLYHLFQGEMKKIKPFQRKYQNDNKENNLNLDCLIYNDSTSTKEIDFVSIQAQRQQQTPIYILMFGGGGAGNIYGGGGGGQFKNIVINETDADALDKITLTVGKGGNSESQNGNSSYCSLFFNTGKIQSESVAGGECAVLEQETSKYKPGGHGGHGGSGGGGNGKYTILSGLDSVFSIYESFQSPPFNGGDSYQFGSGGGGGERLQYTNLGSGYLTISAGNNNNSTTEIQQIKIKTGGKGGRPGGGEYLYKGASQVGAITSNSYQWLNQNTGKSGNSTPNIIVPQTFNLFFNFPLTSKTGQGGKSPASIHNLYHVDGNYYEVNIWSGNGGDGGYNSKGGNGGQSLFNQLPRVYQVHERDAYRNSFIGGGGGGGGFFADGGNGGDAYVLKTVHICTMSGGGGGGGGFGGPGGHAYYCCGGGGGGYGINGRGGEAFSLNTEEYFANISYRPAGIAAGGSGTLDWYMQSQDDKFGRNTRFTSGGDGIILIYYYKKT